jgi:prevent-host-death family protein
VCTIRSSEAKTHLPRLLKEVARGETIVITKHGVPVAKLVPSHGDQKREPRDVIQAICDFRKDKTLGGISIRDLIEEGQRF